MQLLEILTTAQLCAMRNVSAISDAEKFAPSITVGMRNFVYRFAADNKCVLTKQFWQELQQECANPLNVVVSIHNKKARIIYAHKNAVFAKHLGELLKSGYKLCWLNNLAATPINWDNWRAIYAQIARPHEGNNLPSPMSKREMRKRKVDADREKMFGEMAECVRYKKMAKRGFNTTFDELRAQYQHEKYERALRSVERMAREIYNQAI